MNWTCQHTEHRLGDYLDRLLTPEERRAAEAHAAGCADCGPLFKRMGALVDRLHRLEPVETPAGLAERIVEQTLGPREARGWRRWVESWLRPIFQPRFAMGAATVALSAFFVFQGLGISLTEIELGDLRPANLYRAADRQAHLMYARGVKFISDLRVVYEIQSRLQPSPPPESDPADEATPEGEAPADRERRTPPQNRADELNPTYFVLAMLAPPGRSF